MVSGNYIGQMIMAVIPGSLISWCLTISHQICFSLRILPEALPPAKAGVPYQQKISITGSIVSTT
jgi:hypothetical protein